jgi:hypothetical protein
MIFTSREGIKYPIIRPGVIIAEKNIIFVSLSD